MDKLPLFLDGWVEFNKQKWGLNPIKTHITLEGKKIPFVDSIYYIDKKGRVVTPLINAYLPVYFEPTPTKSIPKLYRQWLELAELLLNDMSKYKIKTISFSPDIVDIRVWTWSNFENSIAYSFIIDFPLHEHDIDSSTRNKTRKAIKEGFMCEKTENMTDVLFCLKETEERQNFKHRISKNDLELALKLTGEENFRCYVCYSPNGEPASARVVLHKEGSRAIDLMAGTTKKYLQSGATQLLIKSMLDDLFNAGATSFDFGGANIPNIARAKSDWGGKLTPFYRIESPHLKWYAKQTLKFLGLRKKV